MLATVVTQERPGAVDRTLSESPITIHSVKGEQRREFEMTTMTHEQSAAGIIPDAEPKTFAEVLAKINASDAFFEALANQPDETPILNLNFICCRPRGNATQYPSLQAFEDMFQSDAWQEANADRLQVVDEMLAVAAKPVNLS